MSADSKRRAPGSGGRLGDDEIVAALQKASSPLKTKELAKRLRVGTHHYREFRDQLKGLARSGRIVRLGGNRYSALASRRERVEGTVQWIRSGDAFLLRSDGPDIFVRASDLGGALAGDLVLAEIEIDPRGRRPQGEVVRVLERAALPVVGAYRMGRTRAEVVPRQGQGPSLEIPKDMRGDAKSGDLVEAEVVAHGTQRRGPIGRIVRVLGREGDPRADAAALRAEFGLSVAFPADVEESARAAAAAAVTLDPGRVDRRDLHTITIDPEDARDHDDAVSVVSLADGVIEVGVHIADVAWYVPAGSSLDLEAYRRGTSVYLVDGVVPMLPEPLSAGACSLSAGKDSRALSLFAVLDLEREVKSVRLERTLIRCAVGLSYEEAQAVLDGEGSNTPATRWTLETLHSVAKILRKRRLDRGSLDLDLPEAKILVAIDGTPIDVVRRERFDTHRLIEELMVLANELVAVEALRRGWPVLYRAHDAPDPDRGEQLAALVSAFGHSLRTPATARRLQGLLDRSRGTPEETLVHTAVLRSLKRAEYAPDRPGHFGLASKAYTHFTSPIRRYPDLHLHRVLTEAWLEKKTVPATCGGVGLAEAGRALSEAERHADAAQRDSVNLAKVELMESRLGDIFEGSISSVHPFGFFVLLSEMFVEGLVRVSTLDDDYYELHPESAALVGNNRGRVFRLGDRVRVQVARVDRSERQVDFALLSTLESDSAKSKFDTPGARSYRRSDSHTGPRGP